MIRQDFHLLATPMRPILCVLTLLMFLAGSVAPALAMSSGRGGALPQPLPLFPPDNWWNLDISGCPVDSNSTNYVSYINNGGIRRLHPDLGGDGGTTNDPNAIYGMPYAVVSGVTANDLKAVQFQYWDESDGVDLHTGVFIRFPPKQSLRPAGLKAAIRPTSIGAAAKIDIFSLSITNAIFSMSCITCFMTLPRENGLPGPAPSSI